MKMKNSNDKKVRQSSEKQHNKDKEDNFEENLEDENLLKILKDKSRSNPMGSDDDLSIDIQDALGREMSLSLVVDNIAVTVEDEIVTLEGEVYTEEEKITAGDIATAFAGEDNVNNYLSVINNAN
jgi:osmotically-inducible protein OsmY